MTRYLVIRSGRKTIFPATDNEITRDDISRSP